MSSVPQHHPTVTRERIEKALSPDYLVESSTNILHIRYVEHKPFDSIHKLSFPTQTHYRPTFEQLHQQQRIPYTPSSSSWEPISLGYAFTPTWSTHWLCVKGTVPRWTELNPTHDPNNNHGNRTSNYSTTAYRPYLLLDPSCEAMVYTEKGLPLTSITGGEGKNAYRGSRRIELWLTPDLYDPVTGQFTFYIEIACNGLFGANGALTGKEDLQGHFTLEIAEIALLDTVANQLFWDFIVLKDLANHGPKNAMITERAVLVANAILNMVDQRDRSTFQRATKLADEIFRTDPNPLENLLTHRYDPSENRVYAVGHCHIDSAWLWRYAETRRKIARSWASQTRYMDYGTVYATIHQQPNIYKNIVFTASQMWQYAVLVQDYPLLAKKVRQYIRNGQFVPVGNSWVEPDANMPSGEALVRQLLYGTQFITRYFGKAIIEGTKQRLKQQQYQNPLPPSVSSSIVSPVPKRIPHGNGTYWLPDTFGYCPQLPQIIRGAGLRYFLTQKLSWNLVNKPVHNTFWWSALDGSSVLTHFPPADTYCAHGDVPDIVKSMENNKDISRSSLSLMLYGHGDGGGGPTIPMFEQMHRLGAKSLSVSSIDTTHDTYVRPLPSLPHVYYSTPLEFFDNLATDLGRENNAYDAVSIKGELFLELHNGTLTSQAKMKSGNRYCEQLLHSLEFLAVSVCLFSGQMNEYPAHALRMLWKRVLLNQFHDVLPGSSVADVHKDAEIIHNSVLLALEKLIYRIQSRLRGLLPFYKPISVSSVDTESAEEEGYVYMNCTPYKRICTLTVPLNSINVVSDRYSMQRVNNQYGLVQINIPPYGTTLSTYPPYRTGKETKSQISSFSSLPFPNDPECTIEDNSVPLPSPHITANINYAYSSTTQIPFHPSVSVLPEHEQQPERFLRVYECMYGPHDKNVSDSSATSTTTNNGKFNYIVVDTGCIRVIFSRITGHIVSLTDLRTLYPREIIANPSANDGFEIASPSLQTRNAKNSAVQGGNRFLLYDDVPFFWDAWDTFAYSLEKVQVATGTLPSIPSDSSSSEVWNVSLTVLEAGPLRCRIRCVYTTLGYNKDTWLSQDILLSKDSALIQFNTVVEWHEQHKMLKVEFPLQLSGTSVAVYDTQFGSIERPTHTNTSRDAMQFEVCGHKWGDLSQPDYGVALLNNSKYGYSCRNNRLRLSLLRAPKAPDNQCDMGKHYFSYALLPHIGHVRNNNTEVLAEAMHLNNPVICIPETVRTIRSSPNFIRNELSLFTLSSVDGNSPSSIVLDTIKLPEPSLTMNEMKDDNYDQGDEDYDNLETETINNSVLSLTIEKALSSLPAATTIPIDDPSRTIIIRCYEPYGNQSDGILTSYIPIRSVTLVNLLEEEEGQEGLPLTNEDNSSKESIPDVSSLSGQCLVGCTPEVEKCFLRHPLPPSPTAVPVGTHTVRLRLQPFQIATFRITFD